MRAGEEHCLAVEIACPRQTDRTSKRLVTGVFSHWDNLDPDWNPGGLWRPVRVVETGPVRLARLRCLCVEATDERGRLLLDVTLDAGVADNGEAAPRPGRLLARATGPDGRLLLDTTRDVTLAGGDNMLSWTLDVDNPPRWWPRRLGDQPRCDVEVVVEVDGQPSDRRELRTAFREVRWRQWQLHVNGERLFVMGSFPLQWGYAFGIRKSAVRQARAMVDVLGHHPSVVLWCAHNEPLAVDIEPGRPLTTRARLRLGGSMLLPTWNKNVLDRSITRALHRADPS